MRQWKYRENIRKIFPYVMLGILSVFLCWFWAGRYGVFGAKVDWISQHSVIPEYFRQQFYDTGELFPEFAPNLGGGQNVYNFAYYGLYSPFILLSYCFPFIEMGRYMMAVQVISLTVSVLLMYHWLKKRGFSDIISILTAAIFLLSGPMIFHSYNQIMFVNYMPFLCTAFLGVDRYFEKNRPGLLITSIFLMIMTSFYFSIGGMLVLVLYGMHRYFQEKEVEGQRVQLKGLLKDGFLFLLSMAVAVLMSAALLVPTAMALSGRRSVENTTSVIELILPSVQIFRLVYTPYGIGLTTLVITVCIAGLAAEKWSERVLVYGCVIILTVPLFAYFLNGGLYIRDKVMIPFLPLLCYLIACYVRKKQEQHIRRMCGMVPFLLTVFLLYIGRGQAEYSEYWRLVFIDGIIMCFCFLVFYQKRYAIILLGPPVLFLMLFGTTFHSAADRITSREFYEKVTDKCIKEIIEEQLKTEDGYYRMEQQGTEDENAANLNRIWGGTQYISSMYSSTYNAQYCDFRKNVFFLDEPFRNYLMQSVSENPLYQSFMGVKYIVSEKELPGYKLENKNGHLRVYENPYAIPVAYATDQLIEEKEYRKLRYPYNQTTLLNYAVVKNAARSAVTNSPAADKSTEEENRDDLYPVKFELPELSGKDAQVHKTETGFHIQIKNKKKVTIKLPDTEPGNNDIFFLRFHIKNNHPSKDIAIRLEGQRNKLTARNHFYYNENTDFSYTVNLEKEQEEVVLALGAGDYEITDAECFLLKESPETRRLQYKKLCQSELKLNKKTIKGNRIEGIINVKNNGYFITSIPFDDHFEVKVDGKKTAYEKVNTAFLGFPIEKGRHKVEITYHAPGAKAGKMISVIGLLLCYTYLVKLRNRRDDSL